MKKLLVGILAAGLLLSGCSSSPAPERDESEYLNHMHTSGGEGVNIFDDAELIEAGDAMCDSARAEGLSMSEAANDMAEYAVESKQADADTLTYLAALFEGASAYLCPEL